RGRSGAGRRCRSGLAPRLPVAGTRVARPFAGLSPGASPLPCLLGVLSPQSATGDGALETVRSRLGGEWAETPAVHRQAPKGVDGTGRWRGALDTRSSVLEAAQRQQTGRPHTSCRTG